MTRDSWKRLFTLPPVLTLVWALAACASEPGADAEKASESSNAEPAAEPVAAENEAEDAEEAGEHESGEASEHSEAEEGEESGVYIGRTDTWDVIRRGARLVLAFDPASDAFKGTVENTTGSTLCAVRVEVHLSTRTELGPTARTDLPAGQSLEVEIPAEGEAFETWTAHPEISRCAGPL